MQSHGEQRGHVGAVPGGEGALALQSVDELAPERDRGTEGQREREYQRLGEKEEEEEEERNDSKPLAPSPRHGGEGLGLAPQAGSFGG